MPWIYINVANVVERYGCAAHVTSYILLPQRLCLFVDIVLWSGRLMPAIWFAEFRCRSLSLILYTGSSRHHTSHLGPSIIAMTNGPTDDPHIQRDDKILRRYVSVYPFRAALFSMNIYSHKNSIWINFRLVVVLCRFIFFRCCCVPHLRYRIVYFPIKKAANPRNSELCRHLMRHIWFGIAAISFCLNCAGCRTLWFNIKLGIINTPHSIRYIYRNGERKEKNKQISRILIWMFILMSIHLNWREIPIELYVKSNASLLTHAYRVFDDC